MIFLLNGKIRTKLLVNSCLLISLLIIAVSIYHLSLGKVESFYVQLIEDEHNVVGASAVVKALMLECRKNEKNFLLHKKLIYSKLVFQDSKKILEYANSIRIYVEKSEDHRTISLLDKISESIKSYDMTFSKIVDGHIRKGITPDSGLQGNFRKTAHELFDVHLMEHSVDNLLLSLMKQGRYIRSAQDAVKRDFQIEFSKFSSLLKKHKMRNVYADKLQGRYNLYQIAAEKFISAQTTAHEMIQREQLISIGLDLEIILESMFVPNARSSILQIRQYEKDYLLRKNLLSVQKIHQAITELMRSIIDSEVSDDDATETIEYLKSYQKDFDALVEEDRKIKILKNNLRDRAMEVELAVGQIVETSRIEAESKMLRTNEQVKMAAQVAITICLVTILFGVLFSLLITNSITKPLQAIMDGLSKMTGGNFKTRLAHKETDRSETGLLAGMFNQMANTIDRNSWKAEGRNMLAKELREDKGENELCRDIILFLAKYVDAQLGAIYVQQEDSSFRLADNYSLNSKSKVPTIIHLGQGLVGEAARGKETILLSEVPEKYFRIKSSLGEALPRYVIAVPAIWKGDTQAVIELASFNSFSELEVDFLNLVSESIAIAIFSTKQRDVTLELLQETQQQSEELQTQQEELKTSNEELIEQTQNLQQSEEELKSQQEELQASNEELEEKTEALEVKNEKINQKNSELQSAWIEVDNKSKEIETASRYKSEFLANMSHELRTPLNSLLLLARNLAKNKGENLDEGQVESANIIYNSGEDLLKLINDILDLSKIESGQMEAAYDKVGIRGFADWLNNNFQHMASDKGLDFLVELQPGLPKNIITDRHRLDQIVRNLVANAIKFTDEGGVTVSFCRPEQDCGDNNKLNCNTTLAIHVKDTGIGISPEKQLVIFDAFKQADGGTARKYGGTGLGLSISKKLANLLGGEIKVSSEEDKGATFTLFIPFSIDEQSEKPSEIKKESAPKPELATKDAQKHPELVDTQDIIDDRKNIQSGDKVILIIEDDLNFAKIIMALGQEKGFKCLISSTGFGGLELAERYKPGAIILDIRLPDIDGMQVLESLKHNASLRHIPVHMMSGEEKTIEAFKKGAMGFLTKPISEEGILDAFSRLEEVFSKQMRDLLVVEDDLVMVQEIIDLIGTNEINITTANNGKQAIDVLGKTKIDCMILDIGLPDMTGFDLLEQLEKSEDIDIPPVIIYTGRELTKEEGDTLFKYTDTVIIKGVKTEERLLDETSLFLHQVISDMPVEKRKMIASLYDQDAMFLDKKILVVDDDMRNAFALSKILEERGMQIVIAHDGQHALELMDENHDFDLVLMDIMMPVMDGYETMKGIRAQEKFWDLPIIALTAKAMDEDKSKCMDAGASDYLAKPVKEGRLLSMMRVWLYR